MAQVLSPSAKKRRKAKPGTVNVRSSNNRKPGVIDLSILQMIAPGLTIFEELFKAPATSIDG
jgi:hypothetical protein